MSTEQLKRLAVGLVVLVFLWGGLTLYRRAGGDRAVTFRPTKFDPAAVTTFVIVRPADTVTLARAGAAWTVNGLPAAGDLAEAFLKNAADTTAAGEVVAESKNSHARLGIDGAKARRLTIKAGDKTVASYLLGNRGGGFEAVYLRMDGEDRVWEVKNGIVEGIERPVDDWRDKRILTVASDSVGGIDVTRGKNAYALDRAGSAWTLGKAPADSAAVGRLLGQLASFSASSFPTKAQADSADFGTPHRSLRIRGKTGQVLAHLVFDSTAAGFLVRREGHPVIFRVDTYAVDQLTPADSTLRAKGK